MKHLTGRLKDTIRQNRWTVQFIKLVLVSVVAVSFFSCKGCEPPPKPSQRKPMNIIVILDTSNRIDASIKANQNQLEKDIELVEGIKELYLDQSGRDMFYIPNRLTFVVPNQPGTDPIPSDIKTRLKIEPTPDDISKGKPAFEKKAESAVSAVKDLYTFVTKQNKYPGSDIWNWFQLHSGTYVKKGMRNYIICVSDGYLDFDKSIQKNRPKEGNKTSYIPNIAIFRNDPAWIKTFDAEGYGLLEIEADYTDYDVKFMMVEMKLRDLRDKKIIETYWKRWLSSMGITQPQFVYSSGNTIGEINDFLSQDAKTDKSNDQSHSR